MSRAHVLFVTPIMPQRFGNGLAMRAASVLDALAHRFDVHLFVLPVAGDLGAPSAFVRRRTARIRELDLAANLDPLFALIARILDPEERAQAKLAYRKPYLSRFCTGDSARSLLEWSSEFPVGAVHLMRLYLAPLVQPFLRLPAPDRPLCVLDLDDDEVRTRKRLSRLHADLGDQQAAAVEAAEAKKYRVFADQFPPAFDRVIVCSEADASRLRRQCPGARFAVVPNGYGPIDVTVRRRPSNLGPLRLLLVGNFGYFPNAEAALFLYRHVLPALRRLTDREICIDLAGAGDANLRGLVWDLNVRVHGFVEDLASLYAAADVAVVPMRAGGGTRIKLLEAFAHRVPVVTTSLGSEGIDAVDGEHVLVADDAEAFAQACLRVKERPELAARLAHRAAVLLDACYSPVRVDAAVAKVYAERVVSMDEIG
jgi:glycosyltransferase involved in cell wall biosynthesis